MPPGDDAPLARGNALTATPPVDLEETYRPRTALLVAAVALGGILAPLNSTMLAVALPDIRAQFHVGHGGVGWLVSSYLIAMAVTQPVAGRIGDQIGRARVFRFSLLAFLVLSLAAAAAPTFPLLVALRTGQAVCGAALIPSGLAMMRQVVPPERLGRVNGMNGGLLSLAAAIGPLLGALVLGVGTWRWLFIINVPVIAAALLMQARLAYREELTSQRFVIDWLGVALLAGLFVSMTLTFNLARTPDLKFGLTLLGTIGLAGLGARQLFHSAVPVIEWRLFGNLSFTAATLDVLGSNFVMYTSLLSVPFFLQEVQHRSASASGLALGAMSIAMALLAPLSGRLGDAYGRRLPAVLGGIATTAGAAIIFVGISAGVSPWHLAGGLAVLGLGVGLGTGAATTAAIECSPRALSGAAAGANSMMRYVGSILGTGMLGAVLTTGGDLDGQVGMFRVVFGVLTVMALGSMFAATRIHRFAEG